MPKAKLFLSNTNVHSRYEESVISQGVSDWEDMTDDEINFIQGNLYKLPVPFEGFVYVLIIQPETTILDAIKDIKKAIQDELTVEAEKKKILEKKREDARKKKEAREIANFLKNHPEYIPVTQN